MKCVESCDPLYGYDGTCQDSCPDGYFQNKANYICTLCDTACETCNGPDSTDCLACSSDFETMNCYSDCSLAGNGNVNDGLGGCTKCGNGFVDIGEVCDDGNTNSGDGCSSDC